MILGVGLDIVQLSRIASLIARRGPQRFANRILSQRELLDWMPDNADSIHGILIKLVDTSDGGEQEGQLAKSTFRCDELSPNHVARLPLI